MKPSIAVGITGASGAIYAKVLLHKLTLLRNQAESIAVLMSDNAKKVWQHELGNDDYGQYPFDYYGKKDFHAPFASGSSGFTAMIICPCSMGTLGRIASGISDDLMTRAADVMLKERRRLVLVPRETPFSLIHINNLKAVTEAGGIICPANPSFYSKPSGFADLAATVTDRALALAGLRPDMFRWGEEETLASFYDDRGF